MQSPLVLRAFLIRQLTRFLVLQIHWVSELDINCYYHAIISCSIVCFR